MKYKDLSIRAITGVLLFGLLVVVLLMRGAVFGIVLTLFAFASQVEVYRALRSASFRPGMWTGLLFCLVMYPCYLWRGLSGVVVVFTVLCAILIANSVLLPRRRFLDTVVSVFAMIYPAWFYVFAILLSGFADERLARVALGCATVGAIASDIGAYFVGTAFGKRKLSPAVSSKKTVEGALGGIATSIVVLTLGGVILTRTYYTGLPVFQYSILGLLTSVFGQAGDLMASSLKRYAGIKDFAHTLPGHGGVMDRLDSILFGMVAVYCYMALFIL